MCYAPQKDLTWLLLRPWILLPRCIEIGSSFFIFLAQLLFLGRSTKSYVQSRLAKRLFLTLSNLGPCFIKVGQALSTRPDLLPRDWLKELANLQDNLPPFPYQLTESIIKEDFGVKPSKLFEYFPLKPIAAASLGQVYKARLFGDYWVAVKVQRPNLSFILRRDLTIIRIFGVIFGPLLPLNMGVGFSEIIDEFGRSLFEEIDYEKEAKNAIKFSALFSKNPTVTIPKIEPSLTSKRVVTTSWVDGFKLRDQKELEENNIDVKALIRTAVISAIQQLLEFGYFHADPHPGNIFALKGKTGNLGHIAYVDFGMMDSITDIDRLTLTGAIVHLVNRDYFSLAYDFKKLGFISESTDISSLIHAFEEVFSDAISTSVELFNFKLITDKFSELMFNYPFRVPARFALIIRAIVSQEGLALSLDPQFKIIAIAYPYLAKKLVSANSNELLDILLDVIFDREGNLLIRRVESLISVLINNETNTTSELIPIARSGFKLLSGKRGSEIRRRVLLTLVKDDRLSLSDIKELIRIISKTLKNESLKLINKERQSV